MNANKLITLIDAINLYKQEVDAKKLSNLKSTLKKYVLPGFGFDLSSMEIDKYMSQLLLSKFALYANFHFDALSAVAKANGTKPGTLRNIYSCLSRFLSWMSEQVWYKQSIEMEGIPRQAPKMRCGINLIAAHKGRRAYNSKPYALKEHELPQKVIEQLAALENYLMAKYKPERNGDPAMRAVSWHGVQGQGGYKLMILCFLGWLKNYRDFSIENLDITLMVEKSTLQEYISWQFSEKGNSFRHASALSKAALNIAKWHYGRNSSSSKFRDIPQVEDIRRIINDLQGTIRKNTDRRTTSKEALAEKLISFEQCQEVVDYLRTWCSNRDSHHRQRSDARIADSWQDYLIIGILTYTPIRQREIRTLQLNKNLRRDTDGWWVSLSPDEHKTGSKTGKSREFPLFIGPRKAQLTKDLDTYVNLIRPQENLDHEYLFFTRGAYKNRAASRGRPIGTEDHLTKVVNKLMFKVTGILYGKENAKCPSPQDFRRIFITWFHRYATFEEKQIYAEIMGHSVEIASKEYSQLNSKDKTEGAGDAYNRVVERERQSKLTKKVLIDEFDTRLDVNGINPAILAILTSEQKLVLRLI